MKRKNLFLLGLLVTAIQAQTPDVQEIIDKIDANMTATTSIFESRMVIHGRRGSRTVESKSWSQGEDKSFTEYLAPAREKGIKMLKLEDHLWMYSPSTDRTIQISGHMLRQSVMGSDLSYEDMMEKSRLKKDYGATIIGSEIVDDRNCWILELIANTSDVAYHGRKVWVDKERFVPLREELFAKSGKLLKKTEMSDITYIQGRWFPKTILFKDMLKKGEGTEFLMDQVTFDADIPDYIFSKAALRR